jgi:hypothetical protein
MGTRCSQRYRNELGSENEPRQDGGESNGGARRDETYLVPLVVQKKQVLDRS